MREKSFLLKTPLTKLWVDRLTSCESIACRSQAPFSCRPSPPPPSFAQPGHPSRQNWPFCGAVSCPNLRAFVVYQNILAGLSYFPVLVTFSVPSCFSSQFNLNLWTGLGLPHNCLRKSEKKGWKFIPLCDKHILVININDPFTRIECWFDLDPAIS